ncbi:MAG: type II toxin-antitoxin system RelE/ParE family toxin [Sphingobacteriales bacterium]|nr:MAG: type II toxin-antitoxin system RelE/ParE family toxin [Sphingobacteriales bacterium]
MCLQIKGILLICNLPNTENSGSSAKARFSNDKELFRKLSDEIWEFRTLFNKTHYRLFAFWDKSEKTDTVVISTHGLIKKIDKTPQSDLDKAERLRKKYFKLKDKKK